MVVCFYYQGAKGWKVLSLSITQTKVVFIQGSILEKQTCQSTTTASKITDEKAGYSGLMFGNQMLVNTENWEVLLLNKVTQTKSCRAGNIWRANRLAAKDVGITVNHKLSMSPSVMLSRREPPSYYKYKQDNGVLPSLLLYSVHLRPQMQSRAQVLVRLFKYRQQIDQSSEKETMTFVNDHKKGGVGN